MAKNYLEINHLAEQNFVALAKWLQRKKISTNPDHTGKKSYLPSNL